MKPESKGRLDPFVAPDHYEINYKHIDFKRNQFSGSVRLKFTVSSDETEDEVPQGLVLHALDLIVFSAKLIKSPHEIKAQEIRYNFPNQTVEMIFGDDFLWEKGGSYQVLIDFQGNLNDLMRGLYRSTYVGLDGKTHTMATTQFEPTDARRAFPCLDEPAMKATFAVTVTVPTTLQCISNTPYASVHTEMVGNVPMKTVTFQTTPKMSTYLVALVVGEFDCISTTYNGIQTTVFTVPGKAHLGQFCLDTAYQAIDLYQKLFDIPYPLVKSDLLAIPDFAAGAMENWGCVTYREAKILVKEGATSETTRRGIARTVCHELAHQWFGNLVTMEWWTQLWLNEGMARFMEFVGINRIYPEWDAWTEFVQSVYGVALSMDSMISSHPVEVAVNHPDEIDQIFDTISYAKGSSIIRMATSYIGFDAFLKGMHTYLDRHSYGNARTRDLWLALEEASGLPVVELMTPWTLQVGYPILLLPSDGKGQIKAPRFLASGPGSDEKTENYKWPIPVTAMVEGDTTVHGPWLIDGPEGDESPFFLECISKWSKEGKWFKLNINQTGFFRVAYTNEQWRRLKTALAPGGQLSASDRLGLISDSFAAGRASYTSIVDSLRLVEDFGQHEMAEYAVWQELSVNIGDLLSLYRSESFFPKFQEFTRKIYARQLERLGWDARPSEPQRSGTLRAAIISVLSTSGDKSVLNEALMRFYGFINNGDPIPSDLRGIVLKAAMRCDEDRVYPALKQWYEKSRFPEEQRSCLAVLGSVKDPKRHAEMLDYVLFSPKVRSQDIMYPLNSLSSSSDEGGRACWRYFKDNFGLISSKFEGGPMWKICAGLLCRGLRTLEEADDVEGFFAKLPRGAGSGEQRVRQALEGIRARALRLEREREPVQEFLGGLE